MRRHTRFWGVDFSGAKDAPKKIWMACGEAHTGRLHIIDCQSARQRFQETTLQACLPKLRDFLAEQVGAVIGIDFPFGLPKHLVVASSWQDFLERFAARYKDAVSFKETCFQLAGRVELKRCTDRESATPFSPYNRRIYKQTYFGIRELLVPLALKKKVCVLPFQNRSRTRPVVVEICPASYLKARGFYDIPYKGASIQQRDGRWQILRSLLESGHFSVTEEVGSCVIEEQNGDALDSVIAALAAFHAHRRSFKISSKSQCRADAAVEGYVYH